VSDDNPWVGLRAAEVFFRAGAWAFHLPYDREWRSPDVLPQPVVSVGNLMAGGTGKTPVVRALAEALRSRGLRPAILTRGYRARRSHGVLEGGMWRGGRPASARDAGDEPFLLSTQLPTVPVVIGKHRFREATAALSAGTPVDVWILDDGFQHRRLHRDLDIVLLDADDPLGNGHRLPAGLLREGPKALARAHAVLLTGGAPGAPAPERTLELVAAMAPRAICLRAWTEVEEAGRLHGGSGTAATSALAGSPVWMVAGIARPERFRATLLASGAEVRGSLLVPDHHAYTQVEVNAAALDAERAGAMPVTTEKDAMRLRDLRSPPGTWWVVSIRIAIEGGWDAFLDRALPHLAEGR